MENKFNGTMSPERLRNTFHIDYTSPVDEKRYVGNFVQKKLNIRDLIKLGVRKSELCGGATVTGHADLMAEMVATCEVCLIDYPGWFNDPLELEDFDLLTKIFGICTDWENSFRPDRKGTRDRRQRTVPNLENNNRQSEDSGEMEHSPRLASNVEAVVDEQVSSSTDVKRVSRVHDF